MKSQNRRSQNRRSRTVTKRNQKTLSIKAPLIDPGDGTRPFCAICAFSSFGRRRLSSGKKDEVLEHATFCRHDVKQLPNNYKSVAHFQQHDLTFYRHQPTLPEFVHVLDDATASLIFVDYCRSNRIDPPKSREAMIRIIERIPTSYSHPLNKEGNFLQSSIQRCSYQDRFRVSCKNPALIKESSFCFHHMPEEVISRFLPHPKLEGSSQDQHLTKFIFWVRSKGGTDKDWETTWHQKSSDNRRKIMEKSAQRLKVSLAKMKFLKGNTKKFTWLK